MSKGDLADHAVKWFGTLGRRLQLKVSRFVRQRRRKAAPPSATHPSFVITVKWRWTCLMLLWLSVSAGLSATESRPNILFIFIDDIGWGDLSCYGSPVKNKQGQVITPNLDKLASQGIRFTQGYVAAPICSPSRTGMLTGMEPCRYGIYSFLNDKASNAARNMANWLQPDTVSSPRIFQQAGYRTGQFGKWHMGGGRDVNNAPFPQEYGFDESLVAFEGMGNRVLYNGHNLSIQNADVPGTVEWIEWYQGAPRHTDAALTFITNAVNSGKRFYVHVPYNDTHSPYNVPPGQEYNFDHISTDSNARLFLGELHNLDKEIGRLAGAIDALGAGTNTLMVIVGDNGAPNDAVNGILNRNGGLRGGKGNLYEGGTRELFIVRWLGRTPAGMVNSNTVVSTLDLLPTYCSLAGLALPNAPFAGENMSDVFLGATRPRTRPLFWEYGTVSNLSPGSPKLAMRDGNFKFMRNPDGSQREFYLIPEDHAEATNRAGDPGYTGTVTRMETELMKWYDQVVLGNVGEVVACGGSNAVAEVVVDAFTVAGGNSPGSGFGTAAGVNYQVQTRLNGTAVGSLLGYRLGGTGGTSPRQAADFSIAANRLSVAPTNGNGRFEFSADGVAGFNFGGVLAGRSYTVAITMDIDAVGSSYAQRLSLSLADGSDLPVGDVDLGVQIGTDGAGGLAVFKRVDAASNAGGTDINQKLTNGLPVGTPIELMMRVADHNSNVVDFSSSYQILVNGAVVDSGMFRFNSSTTARHLIFDVAAHEGMVHYDDLRVAVTENGAGGSVCRKPILGFCDYQARTNGGVAVRLYWPAQPGLAVSLERSIDLTHWSPITNSAGTEIKATTTQGSIQWLLADLPYGVGQGAFFRLRKD